MNSSLALKNILLIEDNHTDIRTVELFLKYGEMGVYNLDVAKSFEEALRFLKENEYVVVLTDLNLPDSRGTTTLTNILKLAPQTNVIVLTATDDPELGLDLIRLGAQDFMVKDDLNNKEFSKAIRFAIERTRINKALEEAQRIAHIAHWEYILDTNDFEAPNEAFKILGLEKKTDGKIPFSYIASIMAPEDVERIRGMIKANRNNYADFNVDIRINVENTIRYVYCYIRVYRDKNTRMIRCNGVIQNITDRKNNELNYQKSTHRYQSIFNQSRDAIIIVSYDNIIQECNHSTTQLLGYTTDELKMDGLTKIFQNTQEGINALNKLHEEETLLNLEFVAKTKCGTIKNCLLNGTMILLEDNKGYQCIIRDITELKENEKLIKEKEIAQREAELKEQFLANVSHEMRTPMNAIMGMTHCLKDTPLTTEQNEWVQSINLASDTLLNIINDILDITQIQFGEISFQNKPFKLKKIIDEVFNVAKFKQFNKNVELKTIIHPGVPEMLIGDKNRLHQILMNLVTNAIKFTDQGSITIDVEQTMMSNSNIRVDFRIIDTGDGIPNEKLANIFNKFIQVSDDVRKKQGGTGLGLAITKQLVEKQGGTINVSSKYGVGSTFTVSLEFQLINPNEIYQPNEDLNKKINENADKISTNAIRVLVVEDQKMNQIVAQQILRKKWPNAHVAIAENGKVALQELNLNPNYDIILMDIQMPEMDGYEATKIIRNSPSSYAHLPIIALTAHAFLQKDDSYKEFGFNLCISKPFYPNDLYSSIENLTKL